MKYLTRAFAALLILAASAAAQVGDGSYWSDGAGTTATVDVVDTGSNGGAGNVTVTDDTGFTNPLAATMSSGSTADKPKAQSSVAGDTNSPKPNTYRVKDGKLQKKNKAGRWVTMKPVKKPKSSMQRPLRSLIDQLDRGVGDEGTSLPGGPQSL